MALNPPSTLSTQLFAYAFAARKTAASAISEGRPKRFRGMAFKASERALGVIAAPCILERDHTGVKLVGRASPKRMHDEK